MGIEKSRSEDKVKWDWRLIFKKISSGCPDKEA